MAREGKAKVLTEAEFKRLLIVAKNSPMSTRNVAMIFCSFGLGLRSKEISSLSIKDIADSSFKLLDEINLKRNMTKGEKQRAVYLSNKKIREALQNHLDNLRENNTLPSLPLFQTQRKQRFSANVMQKWFKDLYDKAGIHGASSHSGRRTFITRLIEHGADIKAVSKLAGHSSIMTTAIYVEDNPERLKKISDLAIF